MEVRRMPGEEMSQKAAILQWLKSDPITARQASRILGIDRCAARIDELRKEGHQIATEMIETYGGKHVARYSLVR